VIKNTCMHGGASKFEEVLLDITKPVENQA